MDELPICDAADLLAGRAAPPAEGPLRLRVAGLEPAILARAGVDYDRSALRGLVRSLGATRPVVLLAPLADAATTPTELVEALREAVRLRLRIPGLERVEPSACEATDPWVVTALAAAVLVDDGLGTPGFDALRAAWKARLDPLEDPDERRHGEILLRGLDDLGRRTVFEMLRQAWLQRPWPGGPLDRVEALAIAETVLGERDRWMKAFRQYTYDSVRRLVVIPTWQCELRCTYCFIPKQDGRVMPEGTYERAIELLLSTDQEEVILQFFGGEALLEWPRVRHGIAYAHRRAAEVGKRISFLVSSNGWSLDEEKLAFFAEHQVGLELSLDGDERTQNRFRSSRWREQKSYDHSIVQARDAILASGVDQHVIMVVHPTNVAAMPDNFFHIADLGFSRVQINPMLGRVWTPEQIAVFASGLHTIGRELVRRAAAGRPVELINLRNKPMPVRLNGEVTVDFDGTIYGGNAFLHETEHRDKFVLAHLDDLTGIDRYWIDATDNNFLLDWSYRPAVTRNNVEVGKVMASFLRWLGERLGGAPAERQVTAPSAQAPSRPA